VTTPNLPELAALGGEAQAVTHAGTLLIKGGHAEGDILVDRLVDHDGEVMRWEDTRINTTSTHGTGCTLASAIATGLGQGLPLIDAITRARLFVRAALMAAPGLGQGHGPMGHQAVEPLPFRGGVGVGTPLLYNNPDLPTPNPSPEGEGL
jgi:hydroxymethylpyrimidine/phosphomethylpyrimidine kinase